MLSVVVDKIASDCDLVGSASCRVKLCRHGILTAHWLESLQYHFVQALFSVQTHDHGNEVDDM